MEKIIDSLINTYQKNITESTGLLPNSVDYNNLTGIIKSICLSFNIIKNNDIISKINNIVLTSKNIYDSEINDECYSDEYWCNFLDIKKILNGE